MRLVLIYLVMFGSVAAILYGVPALKNFRVKHKQNVFLSVGVAAILVTIIYFLEQIS